MSEFEFHNASWLIWCMQIHNVFVTPILVLLKEILGFQVIRSFNTRVL